ncbi:sensor histidine kinase [Paractinoplanes rishiriensis]|uniref:histidine kinase n=1 Tax=Paractinoplanes rishiriensis TaxID=1050105 RepID=A0A919K925_9ACTN|nr:histidine kinase [Actinoplanes rishiriensis]GIF01081.1 two-component sensor histidine kinase [Actinoplanes rishiriensis]
MTPDDPAGDAGTARPRFGWARSWLPAWSWSRQDLVGDLLLYVSLAAVVALTSLLIPLDDREQAPLWILCGCLVLLAGLVAGNRTWPLATLLGAAMVTLATIWFSAALATFAYLYGRRHTRVWPALAVFGGAAVVEAVVVLISHPPGDAWLASTAIVIFAGLVPWLIGRYRRQRIELIRAGWVRAEMLEREHQAIADQVRLRERARIAQEMHDSLGHEISLMALRASALEIATDLAPHHQRAANELRGSAAAATERLREIVNVLRDTDDPAPVEPPDESIADLVERARGAGAAIRMTRTGEPAGAPSLVERAAYCVIREAITNATKHAPGAPIEVDVAYAGAATTVSVVNQVPARPPARRAAGNGLGLVGIRERVHLAGGELTVGPTPRGFEVTARLPHVAPYKPAVAPAPVPPSATASARGLDEGRRKLRRGLIILTVTPMLAIVSVSVAYYSSITFGAVLNSSTFDTLMPGTAEAIVLPQLPAREIAGRPLIEPPVPFGSQCRYYSDGGFLVSRHAYRLCFREGVLISKDKLTDRD